MDRDGVINRVLIRDGKVYSPRTLEEFEWEDGIEEAVKRLKEQGLIIIVVTNQPDIARGKMDQEDLKAMTAMINERLSVDAVSICPHDDRDECLCRKPKAGMLLEAGKQWGIDFRRSFMIGDSWKDMGAGQLSGCKTILLDRFYNQGVECDYRVQNLEEAVEVIENLEKKEESRVSYVEKYLEEVKTVVNRLDKKAIESMVDHLVALRQAEGRLFFLGVGGGAGNAAHAVNDFRKIAGIESYTPTDNVSELSARVNDDGWETVFVNWLRGSRLNNRDGIFVFSVGGGNAEKNISANIVQALKYAKEVGAKIFGVVGRDGGYTAQVADACVVIPTVNPETITPHTEAFQGVVWHLLVSHPELKANEMKWESVK